MAGQSQSDVCVETGLAKATVSGIAAALGSKFEQVRTKKTEDDGELIMAYFRAALRAMASQAEVFGDPAYCRTQDAHNLAIAHGVLGDKLAGIATTAQALGLLGTHAANPALPGGEQTE
jgi:hypothetical protein